jgi:thioredoxin 2
MIKREARMNLESAIVICSQCGTKNRIPQGRWGERAVCGKCRAPLRLSAQFPGGPVEVFDKNFEGEVLSFAGPVLLEFYAPWCGHCQRLVPVLDGLAADYAGRVKIAKLNVDQNSATASRYGVRSTPSLFFFKNGRLVDQALGVLPREEIERHLKAIL